MRFTIQHVQFRHYISLPPLFWSHDWYYDSISLKLWEPSVTLTVKLALCLHPPHPHYHSNPPPPFPKKKKYVSIFVILASKLHAADPEPGVWARVSERVKIKKIYINTDRATRQHFLLQSENVARRWGVVSLWRITQDRQHVWKQWRVPKCCLANWWKATY